MDKTGWWTTEQAGGYKELCAPRHRRWGMMWEKEGDGTVLERRGRGFPSKTRQTKRKLASCSRRMYSRLFTERGERMMMEVWGAASSLLMPVKPWSFPSCFFKLLQLLFVCVCVCFFFPFFYILISVFVGRFIYCTPITITICNHVGLWGYDGVRQHRGADRAGRGESHPDDLRSFWQQRSVHHPRRRRQQQQSRPVRGWRGMLTNLDHCLLLYSNLF